MNSRSRATLRTTLLLWGLTLGAPAGAADWYARPGIAGGGEYNDNPSLSSRTDEESSTAGFVTQVSVQTGYLAETSEFWVRPRLRFRRYPSDDQFDSNDKFADFFYDRRFERSFLRLRGDIAREQVRTAELADVGLDPDEPDLPEDDTGVVDDNNDRTRIRVIPTWETQITEKSAVRLNGRIYDVEYDDNQDDQLRDYTDVRGELQYRYAIAPVTELILAGFGRDYTPSGRADVSGYGVRAGFEHELTPTTRLRALAGIEHSEPDEGSSSDDWIADVQLRQRLQTTWLVAGYRRSVTAQGDGDLSVRDQVNLGFTRQLTELLEAGLGIRAYTANGVRGDANDRDYVRVRAEFTWKLARSMQLVGNYRYTIIDREEDDESANANQVFLLLQWGLNPIS